MPKQKKKVGPKARVKIAEPIGEPVVVAFGEEGVAGIFPELAEVRLAGGWLRIIVLAATFGAILGPAVAAMSWARWTAGIGAAFFGLAMVIGQITAAQEHPFRVMRFVDIAFALTVGLVGGALYGVMAVGFIGAGLGAGAWISLGWFYRGIEPPARVDFPGSRTIAAACGVVAEAFYLNPQAATTGVCYGAVIGLGCGVLLSLAMLAVVHVVYTNLPRLGFWIIRPQSSARN